MSINPSLTSSILNSSKKYQQYYTRLNWLILAIAVVSTFFDDIVSSWLALLVLVVELIALLLKFLAKNKKDLGQHCSRISILSNGLGINNAVAESYLATQITNAEVTSEPKFRVDCYYNSADEIGPKRFKEILTESCFWTTTLYKKAYISTIKFFFAYIVVYILVLFFSVEWSYIRENIPFDKIMILAISAAPLKDMLTDSFQLRKASNELERIDVYLNESERETNEIILAFCDYSVATSNTPLIPEKIYRDNQSNLNSLWNARIENNKTV